jgi:hypothetical protein
VRPPWIAMWNLPESPAIPHVRPGIFVCAVH